MAKKRILMFAGCLVISAVCVTGAFAQVTVSGGFALSSVKDIEVTGSGSQGVESDVGVGANLFVDYLLPVGIPLSLGGEIGVDSASFKYAETYTDTVIAIPLLVRAAYHFDLLPKLDLYVVGKIGYVIGIWEGQTKDEVKNQGASVGDIGGVGFGFDVGAAYYFNSTLGLFAEVGFDDYALKSEITSGSFSQTLKAPFNRFLTFGVSGKF